MRLIKHIRGIFACVGMAMVFEAVVLAADETLLMAFFRDNGQDGLYLATSRDALNWEEITPPQKTFLVPKVGGKLMRDPFLALGPDGDFHLVWTTGWGLPPVIGHASSTNLLDWTDQQTMPVMSHEPTSKNAWAPELFYDAAEKQWLVFWSTTIPGRFPETETAGDKGLNHRIYSTTTKDFITFSPSRLFFNDGFNVIDATMFQAKGVYYLVVKDETKNPVRKNLRIVSAERPSGPFGKAGSPISGDWVEGPSVVGWENQWYLYFDHYARPQYYGVLKSSDAKTWTEETSKARFPKGIRHASVLRVPLAIVQRISQK